MDRLLGFFTSKLGIAALAATGVTLLLALVFTKGEQAGQAKDFKATTETQGRITDADARGARTPGDVDKRLRDGSF